MSWNDILGQEKQKEVLRRAIRLGRLPNAYLFIGQEGVGKEATALEVAKTLNCDSSDALDNAEACGVCDSCQKFADLAHPNLELVFPVEGVLLEPISESGSKREKQEEALEKLKRLYDEKRRNPYFTMQMDKAMGILTRQIEILIDKSVFKPSGNKKRVFVLSQAERMNAEAANKLLKLLEEPPPYVLFILISSRPEQLLPTIVSRCQPIRFSSLSVEQLADGLRRRFPDRSESDIMFAARFARGNFLYAQKVLSDSSAKELRDKALNFLRYALSPSKQLELMREIEDLARRSRDEQLQTLLATLLFFQDAARFLATKSESVVVNQDALDAVKRFAQNFPTADFIEIDREIEHARYALSRNANPTLTFAALAIRLKSLIRNEALV
ncbi:MAG: DNA polymerase III subunit delta' [Chloroherpetonaceae bacterium]|nr:DNA polymerase III subunit delta' [Chloroherpetonaceae bacterium]MDW8437148.1 DNA polymerase III subunit delta' C-terminal domain-containing protein [Chloroherpetonaceae bacterium]